MCSSSKIFNSTRSTILDLEQMKKIFAASGQKSRRRSSGSKDEMKHLQKISSNSRILFFSSKCMTVVYFFNHEFATMQLLFIFFTHKIFDENFIGEEVRMMSLETHDGVRFDSRLGG